MKYDFPEGRLLVGPPVLGYVHVDDLNWPGLPVWNVSWWIPIPGSKLGTVWAWDIRVETEDAAVDTARQLLRKAIKSNKWLGKRAQPT